MNKQIRNIAVIAHVDHGKTTLVDALLKQSHVFRDNEEEMGQTQIMDSNDLEKERGITILAKNCSVEYKDTKINIIDTPGHADFSGEVERTLGMADGALLIVDAQEGPMPQTRFVLKKALEQGLKVIVVINKIDKKLAQPKTALLKVESLFLDLAQTEEQLNFPALYAVGARGAVFENIPENFDQEGTVLPLLEAVLKFVPQASSDLKNDPFKMLVASVDHDPYLGRSTVGRIYSGRISQGDKVVLSKKPEKYWKIEKIKVYEGLRQVEVEFAECGEIVALLGISDALIGDTVTDPNSSEGLPTVLMSEPTLHISLGPNTSPLKGKEGEFYTSRQIEERLNKEMERNLTLGVTKQPDGKFRISGRGELHLSILLETMRREGYEMEVGKPQVVLKEEDGKKLEPVEEVSIIVPSEYVGVVSEEMGKRYGELVKMEHINDSEAELIYIIPTRAAMGARNYLLTATKGTLIYNSILTDHRPIGKEIPKTRRGVLIASENGQALAYGLENAQGRGVTFVEPGEKVYEGMIVGINSKNEDIRMNICKGKKLTNMRAAAADTNIQLTPATRFSLEQSLDFLEPDELLEITPENLRLRKKYLTEVESKRAKKQK